MMCNILFLSIVDVISALCGLVMNAICSVCCSASMLPHPTIVGDDIVALRLFSFDLPAHALSS